MIEYVHSKLDILAFGRAVGSFQVAVIAIKSFGRHGKRSTLLRTMLATVDHLLDVF